MSYASVLVHQATEVSHVASASAERIEGDRGVERVPDAGDPSDPAATFPCCLFLDLPGEENRRGRMVRAPLVLLPGNVEISHLARLLITAPEVTGPAPVEWQVQGVQPYGPPGKPLVGKQATLRRVEPDS